MEVPIIESTFVLSGRVRKRHYISQRKTMKKLVPATVKIMTLVIPPIVKMATILEKKSDMVMQMSPQRMFQSLFQKYLHQILAVT